MKLAYCQLKVQELLLYLSRTDPKQGTKMTESVSRQAELIRRSTTISLNIQEKRCTIEELSRRYLINTSSLKSEFKAVYGLPIAAYMKEYRVKKAMELLRSTDDSIRDIAARLGYESRENSPRLLKISYRSPRYATGNSTVRAQAPDQAQISSMLRIICAVS